MGVFLRSTRPFGGKQGQEIGFTAICPSSHPLLVHSIFDPFAPKKADLSAVPSLVSRLSRIRRSGLAAVILSQRGV